MGETAVNIIFLIYLVLGWKANDYLRYHILNVTAEVYNNALRHYLGKLFFGGLLGWITIPLAILHKIFKTVSK